VLVNVNANFNPEFELGKVEINDCQRCVLPALIHYRTPSRNDIEFLASPLPLNYFAKARH